jgi:N-acetylneuraminate synthase
VSPDKQLKIGTRIIGRDEPTYFIADIAANHDGNLERAITLIQLAADAGADAAKFQHFTAETIVSDAGFKSLGHASAHQAAWKKSVFEVYRDASVNLSWTPALKKACDDAGIAFFTSPYSAELADEVDPYVPAFKIGSGDITWTEVISHVAAKMKPVLLATGASNMDDVIRAMNAALSVNSQLALLQCNTNYTASLDNFRYINLNVLRTYREIHPDLLLGLSDHTPGHATVLGAVSLGARIIEKHFTDDTSRTGPDHAFSMDPASWDEMVKRTRELENALGAGVKKVEENERETSILQRRCIRAAANMDQGSTVHRTGLTVLRPCPTDGIPPYEIGKILGRKLRRTLQAGDHVRWTDLE